MSQHWREWTEPGFPTLNCKLQTVVVCWKFINLKIADIGGSDTVHIFVRINIHIYPPNYPRNIPSHFDAENEALRPPCVNFFPHSPMLGLAKAIYWGLHHGASWCIMVHHDHHAIQIPTAGQKKWRGDQRREKTWAQFANPVVSPWRWRNSRSSYFSMFIMVISWWVNSATDFLQASRGRS